MSLHLVQDADLVYAEAMVSQLRTALLAKMHPSSGFDAEALAIKALGDSADYCRPSCGYLETGECSAGDGCGGRNGCLCRHDDTAAV